MLTIKRIYENYEPEDGYRVLIDRLWPRGIKKENAHLNLWMKEIAPSTELRKWFNHEPKNWEGFKTAYQKELKSNDGVEKLKEIINENKKVTLLFGAKSYQFNHALVLQNLLKDHG